MPLYERVIRRRGSGDYLKGRAGENLGRGQLVYKNPNGAWYRADADAAATVPVIGITLESASTGQIVRILTEGYIGANTWAWTTGGDIYASQTPGALTQTPPPIIVQWVGMATSPTMIYFDSAPPSSGSHAGGGRGDYTYLVDRYDGNYVVYDDRGNVVSGPGVDADTQINWALTTGGSGCVVYLEEDTTFAINDPITFTASNQVLRGGGRGTFINGDALATGEHAITISSDNDCVIRDLSIQTQDGGTKTCHCIFIDNASSRTLIENVTFVDSDDNCIHIEGISQGDTRILNCDFLGADGHGIYTNMDPANAVYFLKVRDCRFTSVGGDGIHLEDAIDCQIFDNTFDTSIGSDGIELVNSDDCHIAGNTMSGTTGYDINISAANCDRTRVFNNILHGTGTGCINDAGTDTRIPEFNVTVENTNANIGCHPVAQMLDGVDTTVRFGFTLPLDFQELVTAQVVIVPGGTGNIVWRAFTDYGKVCVDEDYNVHSDSVLLTTSGVTINDLECLDVSAALNIAAPVGGDRVGMEFWRDGDNDTVNASVYVVEIRVRYV